MSRARLITFLFSILVFIGLGLAIAWEFGGLGRIVSTLSSFEPKTYQNYQEESRMDIYHNLLPTARQIPTWGFGPGSFAAVYLLQRGPVLVHGDNTELVKWSAWAHCDPLEFFITFGVVGSILLVLFLGVAVGRPLFFSIKSHAENDLFVPYIALSGCLLHSFVDFPFQIYSLVHLFLAILAITWVAAESTNSLTLPHAPATERS